MTLRAEVVSERRFRLAEGPQWHPATGTVSWVDIHGGTLWQAPWSAHGALEPEQVLQAEGTLGAAIPADDGGWVVLDGTTVRVLLSDGEERRHPVPDADLVPGLRLNDGACDPAGRLLAGTIDPNDEPGAALYQLRDGGLHRVLNGVTTSNGLAWSADGTRLYYADSPTGRVDRFEYDVATGELGARRPVVHFDDGVPDGLCLDADEHLWVAVHGSGQVRRVSPDGEVVARVDLPTGQVSSCAFVGADLRSLLVTTGAEGLSDDERRADPAAGAVFAVRGLDVPGLPRHTFATRQPIWRR